MKILITGAKGFVGRNLSESFRNIRDGKDRVHRIRGLKDLSDLTICTYDIDSSPEELDQYCADADFVFHLAGVNRPKDPSEFMKGNFGFASILLDTLKKHGNRAPVMLSSSIQASLEGRFAGRDLSLSLYGRSPKKPGFTTRRSIFTLGIWIIWSCWPRSNTSPTIADLLQDFPDRISHPWITFLRYGPSSDTRFSEVPIFSTTFSSENTVTI